MELSTHYPICLPTKAYLKPYLESLYGSPVIINPNNTFGVLLSSLLHRPRRLHERKDVIEYRVFDKFNTQLLVYLPKWWLTKYEFGHTLEEEQIISLNKFFEEQFEERLVEHCSLAIIYHVEIKKALEEFCWRHKIEIEEHITYDALKKKEYRARKEKEKTADLSTENSFKNSFFFSKKKVEINTAELSPQKLGFIFFARA
jgi:hypothetical protein